MKAAVTYGIFLWLMALLCSCSFSVFPKQEQPPPPPPDSSNVARADSIMLRIDTVFQVEVPKALPEDYFSDAPEPVTVVEKDDAPLIAALANERDYYRDKAFALKDEIANRDIIIQQLSHRLDQSFALLKEMRAEVKPVQAAPEADNSMALMINGIAMLVAFFIGKFFNKKQKA